MQRGFSQVLTILVCLVGISLLNTSYIYGGTFKDEAKSYREKGYEAQERGDIDAAINWYQKAGSLDKNYAAPHNDLGILFEAKGWLDRAESEYQKALTIDPDYGKAHTNIALLYERKGELEKAAYHWMRRYKLGKPNDAWTHEARQRLEKLGLVDRKEAGKKDVKKTFEQQKPEAPKKEEKKPSEWTKVKRKPRKEAVDKKVKKKPAKKPTKRLVKKPAKKLVKKLTKKPKPKKIKKKEKKKTSEEWTRLGGSGKKRVKVKRSDIDKELQESLRLAEERLRKEKRRSTKTKTSKTASVRKARPSFGTSSSYAKARNYLNKGEYTRALEAIRIAKKDNPDDPALLELEETIKNKMKEERIEDHYNEGMMHYSQDDFQGARKEFEAILNILPE